LGLAQLTRKIKFSQQLFKKLAYSFIVLLMHVRMMKHKASQMEGERIFRNTILYHYLMNHYETTNLFPASVN